MGLFVDAKTAVAEELSTMKEELYSTRANATTFFAVFCVLLVLVANVVLLIAINFWLSIMPLDSLERNSSQIAIQVVSLALILGFFTLLTLFFAIFHGWKCLYGVIMRTDCVGGRLYRFSLLIASGVTNGLSSVLAVYAMTYTPQFLQAVLLCAVPFSAQAWTVWLIPLERRRKYLSLLFMASLFFFTAGVTLSSMNAFMNPELEASMWWALMYAVSAVIFGLWCVVQRLYLDAAIILTPSQCGEESAGEAKVGSACSGPLTTEPAHALVEESLSAAAATHNSEEKEGRATWDEPNNEQDVDLPPPPSHGSLSTHEPPPTFFFWGSADPVPTATKLVLLVCGVFVQLLFTLCCFFVDVIPWFGTSNSVGEAWNAFESSVIFIFDSWFNVKYGLLYSLGFAMSFIGCTYLNEHSPTLASIVLQLAGPVTSLMIVLVPSWNVYHDEFQVWWKISGIVLLFMAAGLYQLWDQHSYRCMMASIGLETVQVKKSEGKGEAHKNVSESWKKKEVGEGVEELLL